MSEIILLSAAPPMTRTPKTRINNILKKNHFGTIKKNLSLREQLHSVPYLEISCLQKQEYAENGDKIDI